MAKQKSKRQVTEGMRVKAFAVFERALESGVARGIRRAHKHTDSPNVEHLKDEIVRAVLDDVCEVFSFDDEGGS